MKEIPLNERIILALDVENAEQAKELVRTCSFSWPVGLKLSTG
jgi:orotidine-5'-phosphate decarboxylase